MDFIRGQTESAALSFGTSTLMGSQAQLCVRYMKQLNQQRNRTEITRCQSCLYRSLISTALCNVYIVKIRCVLCSESKPTSVLCYVIFRFLPSTLSLAYYPVVCLNLFLCVKDHETNHFCVNYLFFQSSSFRSWCGFIEVKSTFQHSSLRCIKSRRL